VTLPLDLVIVGAGPSGLAAAIAAQQAGLGYEVLEKGALVNSIFHFPRHMTFFTTADLLEIGGLPFVTPFEKPTQAEGLKYYRKATEAYSLRVALGEEVTGVRALGESDGGARFVVQTRGKDGAGARRARNVVFATGYYDNPNLIGVPGEDLPHVSHYYTTAPGPRSRSCIGARAWPTPSSTGSGPTSRTASRRAPSPRASEPA